VKCVHHVDEGRTTGHIFGAADSLFSEQPHQFDVVLLCVGTNRHFLPWEAIALDL
jgi:hypothetical protein